MTDTSRRWSGRALIVLGVLVYLIEVALYVWGAYAQQHIELPHMVTVIGTLFGFVGLYMEDPKSAKDGGDFIVTQTERLARALPFGRRKTDPVGVPSVDAHPVVAVKPPPEPTPTDHGGGL